MSGFLTGVAITVGVALFVIALRWLVEAAKRGAVAEERIRRMEQEAQIAAKQAAEVVKERTIEDVVRDLDAGNF